MNRSWISYEVLRPTREQIMLRFRPSIFYTDICDPLSLFQELEC